MISLPFLTNNKTKCNGSDSPLMIDIRDVNKFYKTAAGDYQALKDIDLQINTGEFVSIIGKSGSGKSTLLNMISGIDHPTNGEVWVHGTPIHELNEDQMALWTQVCDALSTFTLLPS